MEEESAPASIGDGDPPVVTEAQEPDPKTDGTEATENPCDKNESGVVLDAELKQTIENEAFPIDDARSLGELDCVGATGSDSGVEGCGGRALSSGGGEQSCASSVVSCGSGCGSESSSLASAPTRRRRPVVTLAEPPKRAPSATSTPRPVTAPRAPNLATRDRARSREKPVVPEKPRPLTPKPRIRPNADLPCVVRESPALRAKPTKTSTARCRTPSSPSEEKRWPTSTRLSTPTDASAARMAADKYGTLPRRRRDDGEGGSPKHDVTPPTSRRPTVSRSMSTRSTAGKTRVRIYAEKVSQTVLVGTDLEAAFAGLLPNIDCSRVTPSVCSRGVQASARDETAALAAAAAAARADEAAGRARAEHELRGERAARLAAENQLHRNNERLLELAGAGAESGADGCLRALEEQLRAAGELARRQRAEIEALRGQTEMLQAECSKSREQGRVTSARLAEVEREAAEMQDFLAAETGALADSLRDAEADLASHKKQLEQSRSECRQLVRLCEQRRQEALALWRRGGGGVRALRRAVRLLDALARRLAAATAVATAATAVTGHSRSDSIEGLSEATEGRGALVSAVTRALRLQTQAQAQTQSQVPPPYRADLSHASDDFDNSADLLDSETEPFFDMGPVEYGESWLSSEYPEFEAWSCESSPLSPGETGEAGAGEGGEGDSLHSLSAAIARARGEAGEAGEGGGEAAVRERVRAVQVRVGQLVAALAAADVSHPRAVLDAVREKLEIPEKAVDGSLFKLADFDASNHLVNHYSRNSIDQLDTHTDEHIEVNNLKHLEEELSSWSESERRERYEALDAALSALTSRPSSVTSWPRLRSLATDMERLAFALATPPPPPPVSASRDVTHSIGEDKETVQSAA